MYALKVAVRTQGRCAFRGYGTLLALPPCMTKASHPGSLLAPDDLRVGSYIVIHSAAMPRRSAGESDVESMGRLTESMTFIAPGMPLQVKAVSLPFVACGLVQPGGGQAGPVILDVRGLKLMAVSHKFVAAIRGFKRSERDKGGDAAGGLGSEGSLCGCNGGGVEGSSGVGGG